MRRFVVAAAVVLGALTVAPAAQADIASLFAGDLTCTNFENGTPGDTSDDQRRCGADGTNEVQTVQVTATGGTFTLTFDGQTTGPIAFDATPAAVDAALEGLSSVGTGAVDVTGSSSNYTVTFTGSLARTDVPELTSDASGLIGTSPDIDIATTTPGVAPSTTGTFDGVPIDANVSFPEAAEGDGPFPLIVYGHGYGGAKIGFAAAKRFTDRGYAVMALQARGFRESCGSTSSRRREGAACDEGWVHLMDTRYEIHDYQHLAGLLVDEGYVVPDQIGAVGGSYGGGLSMALGALRNRVMETDGTLVPWVSPGDETPMELAAATPNIPWTDLSYSLVPNGRTLDYVVDNDYGETVGVMKQSYVNSLYLGGLNAPGFYAAPGVDPGADLTGWRDLLLAGEPYGDDTQSVIDEISQHHSSYYIDDSVAPAPMLISNGFTDDLFPADEAVRFYNKTRVTHPATPISLFFGDFGHPRAANKTDVSNALRDREDAWLDFYVKGEGAQPPNQVETWTQTCPNPASTPSGGPFTAPNWAELPKGELRFSDAATRTIESDGGDPAIVSKFNPPTAALSNLGPCGATSAADEPGTVNYRLPAMSGDATFMGSATVIADINSPSPNNQIAARLLDVGPDGQQRLVARALLRPAVGNQRQVFQLHPNGYTFAAGHVPKLQLLPKDSAGSPTDAGSILAYSRASNGQTDITVSNLELRLPVMERPGALGGDVKVQRDEFVPQGRVLFGDFAALANDANASVGAGPLRATKKAIAVPISAPGTWDSAHATIQVFAGPPPTAAVSAAKGKKKKKKPKTVIVATGSTVVPGGTTGVASLALTKQARKSLRGKVKVTVRVTTAEQDGTVVANRTAKFAKKKKKGKKKKKK
jgi:predicted acyl esterase